MGQTFARYLAPRNTDGKSTHHNYAALSRYLHEPGSVVCKLLSRNRNYLEEVERFRNKVQPRHKLKSYVRSFQFNQSKEFVELLASVPGSRILASFHFGDYIYGSNVAAGFEDSGRRQYFLTQRLATHAFLSNMNTCFGEDGFERRQQITTGSVTAMSLVAKLRTEQCSLLTFVDLPTGFGERIPVRFLGRDAWFPKGPALLSLASGAPLIPIMNLRVASRNEIVLFPLIETYRRGEESVSRACARITQQLISLLECSLREYPWQWRYLSWLPAYFEQPIPTDRKSRANNWSEYDNGSHPGSGKMPGSVFLEPATV